MPSHDSGGSTICYVHMRRRVHAIQSQGALETDDGIDHVGSTHRTGARMQRLRFGLSAMPRRPEVPCGIRC